MAQESVTILAGSMAVVRHAELSYPDAQRGNKKPLRMMGGFRGLKTAWWHTLSRSHLLILPKHLHRWGPNIHMCPCWPFLFQEQLAVLKHGLISQVVDTCLKCKGLDKLLCWLVNLIQAPISVKIRVRVETFFLFILFFILITDYIFVNQPLPPP